MFLVQLNETKWHSILKIRFGSVGISIAILFSPKSYQQAENKQKIFFFDDVADTVFKTIQMDSR